MKMLVQRVLNAKIEVNFVKVAHIQDGILVYLGIHKNDTTIMIDYLTKKLVHLRIFEDKNAKMNLSAIDLNKEILVIPQFTLYANTKKGFRPNFMDAMEPKQAKKLFNQFLDKLNSYNLRIQSGIFGAMMNVTYTNNGPISIIINKEN